VHNQTKAGNICERESQEKLTLLCGSLLPAYVIVVFVTLYTPKGRRGGVEGGGKRGKEEGEGMDGAVEKDGKRRRKGSIGKEWKGRG
jgi:hypothetical protein